MIKRINKVCTISGQVTVKDSDGYSHFIQYSSRLHRHWLLGVRFPTEAERPHEMTQEKWGSMASRTTEAIEQDLRDQLIKAGLEAVTANNQDAQADQMEADLAADPTAEESSAKIHLQAMAEAADVVSLWASGDLAGAIRALEATRAEAAKILADPEHPEPIKGFPVEEEIPLVEPDRLDRKFLPADHIDIMQDSVSQLVDGMGCSVGEAYRLHIRAIESMAAAAHGTAKL